MLRLFNRISVRSKFIAGSSAAFIWTALLGGFAVQRLDAVERSAPNCAAPPCRQPLP